MVVVEQQEVTEVNGGQVTEVSEKKKKKKKKTLENAEVRGYLLECHNLTVLVTGWCMCGDSF